MNPDNTITSLTDDNVTQNNALADEIEATLNTPTETLAPNTSPIENEVNKPLGFNTDKMPLDDDIQLEEIKSEAQPLINEVNLKPDLPATPTVQTIEESTLSENTTPTIQPVVQNAELPLNKKIRVAINGFGRIGRQFFKVAFADTNVEIIAINDLGDLKNLAYLLQYDTVYGMYDKSIQVIQNKLEVEGKSITFLQEKDPANLPWKDLGIDVVVESTGFFTSSEKSKAHLDAGAKRVVISAPAKDEETPTVTPNNNTTALEAAKITSNASCTTNAATPIAAILELELGIESAILNTIHGYTSTQVTVDGASSKDYRKGRAAAQNIIPTSSGAASATEKAVPQIKGKMDAMAMRVPVPSGSILDFTFVSKTPTSVEEINNIFRSLDEKPEWEGVVTYTEDPLVSSDILKNPHGGIVDLALTRVINKNLVKVCVWYDNEWGYVNMLLKHVLLVGKLI